MLAQYIRDMGIEQGIQQGTIETSKENIIEALELRFGKVPPEIIEKINSINDIKKLKELLRKAIQMTEMDRHGFFS